MDKDLASKLENCLLWVRRNGFVYREAYDLALDYGKRGTSKFFPLSELTKLIESDYRFKPHLRMAYE